MQAIACLLICAVAVIASGQAAWAHAQRARLALVIGNSDYDNDGVVDTSTAAAQKAFAAHFANDLANPVNDAIDIALVLRKSGFQTRLLTNADRATMDAAIKKFAAEVKAAGRAPIAVLYFAGHGVSIEGSSYLAPVSARITPVEGRGITAGSLNSEAMNDFVSQSGIREHARQLLGANLPKGSASSGGSAQAALRTQPEAKNSGAAGVASLSAPASAAPPPAMKSPPQRPRAAAMEARRAILAKQLYPIYDVIQLFPVESGATRLLIFDNCRNNPWFQDDLDRIATPGTPMFTDGGLLIRQLFLGGFSNHPIVLTSARPGEVALDGSGRNSPLVVALKRNIGESQITIGDMLSKTVAQVKAATHDKQEPALLLSGSHADDCLTSCPSKPAAASSAAPQAQVTP